MSFATATATPPWLNMPAMYTPDIKGFWDRMSATPQVLETLKNVRVGATPHEVIYTENKLRVLHYQSDVEKQYRTPLLMVFALVNRPYILDLLPHKSVVRHFLDRGFDVYLVDWGVPSDGDKHLRTQDYVEGYLHRVVKHVCEHTDQPHVSLLGYCMGGTLSSMFTSLYPELVRNLIMMAAPVDWSDHGNLLSVWSDEKYFDVDALIDSFGNAPPEWLQGAFATLKPISNLFEKYLMFYDRMTDQRFVEEFFAMETWINDNIPVAGETFREFVKYGFQRNLLIKGKWPVGKRKFDLSQIECPLLNLTATEDHLVPCGQSLPLNDLVSSKDRKAINFRAGHIGLSIGSRAQRDLWPKACEWLGERSESV